VDGKYVPDGIATEGDASGSLGLGYEDRHAR
jgi:hypothetical protein